MTQFNDLIQIYLPTHNGQGHLATALDSLVAQTHENIEIVVMDNASTDGTEAIANQYARRDCRIRYFRSEHFVCATDNWNRAYGALGPKRSEFFMWASDDDYWTADYVASLLEPLKRDGSVVLSYSEFDRMDKAGQVLAGRGYTAVHPTGGRFRRVRSLLVSGQYSAIYGLIRRSAISWAPVLSDESFGSDLWFMIQLAAAGPFAIVKRPLFRKRLGGISETGGDVSASHDPAIVWNIGGKEWEALSELRYDLMTRCYIFNRLKVSAKLLHPEKKIDSWLIPWVHALALMSNPRTFGLRTRLRQRVKDLV